MIVVDYLQLINGDRKRNENREQEIARVSRGLKQLAKKLHCPVLTASQLNDDGQRNTTLSLKLNGRYQRFEPSFGEPAESPKEKNRYDFRKGGDRNAN